MDRSTSTSAKSSGIPRLSRLPVPLAGPASDLRPSASRERLEADPGLLVSRLRTARSRDSLSSTSPRQPPPLGTSINGNTRINGHAGVTKENSVIGRRTSLPRFPNFKPTSSSKPNDDAVFKKPLARPPSRQQEEATNGSIASLAGETPGENVDIGRPRGPSLSERTIETLSQLPPSPSPRRRQSSFYSTASPMRPSSAMSNGSRPGSSAGNFRKPSAPEFGSPAPTQRSLGPRMSLHGPGFSTPLKRSLSTAVPRGTPSSTMRQSIGPGSIPSKMQAPVTPSSARQPRPSSAASNTRPKLPSITSSTKSFSGRPLKPRPSLNGLVPKPVPSTPSKPAARTQPNASVKRSHPSTPSISSVSSSFSRSSKASMQSPTTSNNSMGSPTAETPKPPQQPRKPSSTSLSLRETIAKAKAARRSDANKQLLSSSELPGLAVDGPGQAIDNGFDFGLPVDPFNQQVIDGGSKRLLRKRVDAARTDGRLNIAAMGLKEVPEEVMEMYEYDPATANNGEWYESVDLVRFIAADNEIEEISDWVFPDIDPRSMAEGNDQEKSSQFGGLETLDLHGNLLRSLPLGLRRLERLSTLNLSNNQLSNDILQVVCQIQGLRDLKLANNSLTGEFGGEIGALLNLEVLDVHCNKLVSLPDALGDLHRLRILNVSDNKISSLPFDAVSKLPLTELNVAKNNLSGPFLPASVESLGTLQTLNASSNALTSLSSSGCLKLPAIQQINILGNRITALPDMSSWTQLVTLAAEDNNISELPEGFISLPRLKTVDFTGNAFVKLDEHIGMMETLEIFRVANNPLRERNFLSVSTDDLKRILRSRLAPEEEFETADEFDAKDEGATEIDGPLSPRNPKASVVKSNGVLDRSNASIREFDLSEVESIATKHDVKCVELHHNHLLQIPLSLFAFSTTLTSLNLSHNELSGDTYLREQLTLPQLRELNISCNTITMLEPLLQHLNALALEKLDVSFNRVRVLPVLRRRFPRLITLLASNNAIDDLNVDTIKGLRTVDLSSNDIAHLPPKLGLVQSIRQLDLRGNRFRVPKYTVLEKGTEAVMTWLRDKVPVDEREGLEGYGDGQDEEGEGQTIWQGE